MLASDAAKPFESISHFPAGSLSSTAEDMAKFMLVHLQHGQFGDAQILKPETAKLMHSRLFTMDEAANGLCYGFYEGSRNGHRIIEHAGDTILFHSELHLIPDAGVGLFVSYNSLGKGEASPRTMLWEAFLDRYFPYTPPDKPTLESAKKDAEAVSGTYMVSRRSDASFLYLLAVLGEVTVLANDDGTISVDALTDPNGKPKRWREVAPLQFRDVKGQDKLIFKPDQNGRMQLIISLPFMIFKRVGFFENSGILLPVAGISLLIMLLTLVLWFPTWLIRRHYGKKLELTPKEWWLRLGVRIVFALNLIFIVGLVGFVAYALTNFEFLSDRGNVWVIIAQIIGVIGVIGTLVVFYNAVHAWMSKRYRIWGKLQATVFALASLGFLWLVFAGNLLSFTSSF